MSHAKRKALKDTGRAAVDKTAVIGVKDWMTGRVVARSVKDPKSNTIQGFVTGNTAEDATVYTDEARTCSGIARKHETVNHSAKEFVRQMAHTNGIKSFWALLKRGCQDTFHHFSDKHLDRYVAEFAGRHNLRGLNTADIFKAMVKNMEGKRVRLRELMA